MTANSRISRSTVIVMLGIAATAGWLGVTFWDTWTVGHISTGRICLVHVGNTEQAMPTICAMADARDPERSGTIQVILSRDHLRQLSKSVDEQMREKPPDRTTFGTYEIHDSIHPRRNGHTLSNAATRVVVRRLMDLTDSPSKSIQMDQLAGVVMSLELNSAAR